MKFMTKKKTLYGDVNVEEFYTETISGAGGAPKGLERDLITKFFGNGDFHGRGDHEVRNNLNRNGFPKKKKSFNVVGLEPNSLVKNYGETILLVIYIYMKLYRVLPNFPSVHSVFNRA